MGGGPGPDAGFLHAPRATAPPGLQRPPALHPSGARALPEPRPPTPRPVLQYDAHHMKEPNASPARINPGRRDMWCGRRCTPARQSNHRPRVRIARQVPGAQHESMAAVDGATGEPAPRMDIHYKPTRNVTGASTVSASFTCPPRRTRSAPGQGSIDHAAARHAWSRVVQSIPAMYTRPPTY